MKTKTVKKLMVPLPEHATVTKEATLLDVILALENAQKAFDNDRYRHRAISGT